MGRLWAAAAGMMAAQLLPGMEPFGVSGETGDDALHYRPLNGDRLRELARRQVHHGREGFVNPMGLPRNGRFGQLLKWKFFQRNAYADLLDDQPVRRVTVDWAPIRAHKGVSVTFVKHSTLLIKDVDRILLIDPVFGDIFWFIKDFTPLGFDPADMPRPDHVLITHGHYDHLDSASLATLASGTHVISPLGYDAEFDALGMHRRTQLDWYQVYRDGGREITLLPANHWTMRSPLKGPNHDLWGGYLIRTAGGPVIYVSGDSAYFDGFEQLADDYAVDLAVFNMGAYAPRWFMAPSHMDPEETVRAFSELRARRLMITHWGTFRLGDEPVHFPPLDLKRVLTEKGLLSRWVELNHGQTYYF